MSICYDLSYFKETLKQLRYLDDTIIARLNSIQDKSNLDSECSRLYAKLNESNIKREVYGFYDTY